MQHEKTSGFENEVNQRERERERKESLYTQQAMLDGRDVGNIDGKN